MKKGQPLLFVMIANAISLAVLLLFFDALHFPTLIPCTYPLAQSFTLALGASLVIHSFIINRIWLRRLRPIIVVYSLLLLLILWLGSYPFSPLGFSTGRIPVLRGFIVTRFGRPALSIASGEIVTIAGDSIIEIKPITIPADANCIWFSTNGGALDDPRSCDIAYFSPGGADYDLLKLLIQPGCHLPNARGEIRISILP